MLHYVIGDATDPGIRPAIIAHVANDLGLMGSGFVIPLCKRYPMVRKAYETWYHAGDPTMPQECGWTQLVQCGEGIVVANMIAQHETIRTNDKPIRYDALKHCLSAVYHYAHKYGYVVVAPRLGAVRSGGSWPEIEEIIKSYMTVDTYIYTLENEQSKWDTKVYEEAPKAPEPKTIIHDPVNMRISHIMLEVQRATEFPIHIKLDRSTFKIRDKDSANLFSLGMIAAFDGKNIEEDYEEENA